ncbi:diheme cytochrome c [Rhodoferax lithotrophicus]|nr:diheme cytochrome c [Rhodoferax sp. MIZ03]
MASGAHDNVWQPAQDNALWRSECGACHMAFPPGLLSSDDWLDLMSNLDKHFGVDASVDAQTRAEISEYLKQNAASNRLFGSRSEVPRITTSDRFVGKHRSAIRLWMKGKLKSLSDCGACHKESGLNISE